MDLLRMADDYQSLANEHSGLAAYAAQNAADKIRFAAAAVAQADTLIAHVAAAANGECPRCVDGSACGALVGQSDCPLGRGQAA